MPQAEYIFDSPSQASQYVGALLQGSRRASLGGHSAFRHHSDRTANKFGGSTYFSSHRKELISHQNQRTIWAQDRRYLFERDPLARKIVEEPAQDVWLYPPTLGTPSFDEWLEEQWYDKGFGQAAEAAHVAQRRDGFGLILAVTGDPDLSQPLMGRSNIIRYQHITIDDLSSAHEPVVRDETESLDLYPHGIALVHLDLFDEKGQITGKLSVDGTRLIMPPADPMSRSWWVTPILDRVYNDLWNLADAVSASTKNIEQGNPVLISVETDPSALSAYTELDDDEIDEQMDHIAQGDSDYVGPVKGLEVQRLGKNEVEDPTPTIRLLASRISNGTPFRVNEILASSRGSEQVTPEDDAVYQNNIRKIQIQTVYPTIRRLITLGKRHAGLPRRPTFHVGSVRWQSLRVLSPKEEVFVEDRQAGILAKAGQAGRRPPDYINERWPEGEEVDEERILPRINITREGGLNGTFRSDQTQVESTVRAIMEDMRIEDEMLGDER